MYDNSFGLYLSCKAELRPICLFICSVRKRFSISISIAEEEEEVEVDKENRGGGLHFWSPS